MRNPVPRPRLTIGTLVSIAFALLSGAGPARAVSDATDTASCPATLYQFHGTQATSPTPSDERALDGATVGYDCPAGELFTHSGQRGYPFGNGDAALRVSDLLTVTGIPDGAPVAFQASLHVTGGVAGPVSQLLAWVANGTAAIARVYRVGLQQGTEVVVDTTLTITVRGYGGLPIPIATMGWATCDGGWSYLDATLSYSGLPAGAVVTSCRGYGIAVAVPPAPSQARAFAFEGPAPNPARGTLAFAVSLAPGPARLELFDASGRRVRARALDGAGRSQVVLERSGLAPGIYLARLTQAGRTLERRALLLPQ
ncbi:MAG TPA: T9SS type A sorting domain-containing protein [Candidatus Eisenbacteria bacterium]|nr:T9SS type A sorting domain-containing protein [Candidatus Eisenbacteria bacterium]